MVSSNELLEEHRGRLDILESDLCASEIRISAYHDPRLPSIGMTQNWNMKSAGKQTSYQPASPIKQVKAWKRFPSPIYCLKP